MQGRRKTPTANKRELDKNFDKTIDNRTMRTPLLHIGMLKNRPVVMHLDAVHQKIQRKGAALKRSEKHNLQSK